MRSHCWRKFICLLVLFICFSIESDAQTERESQLEETGLWFGAYIRVKLSDKLGYYGEHHLRYRNSLENVSSFIGRTRQSYNRAGLSIQFSENMEAIIGPTLVWNYSPDPDNPEFVNATIEPRIWTQLLYKNKVGKINFYHQIRTEHRWKKPDHLKGSDFDYTDRFRYKFFLYIPLNKPVIEKNTVYFSPSAELFMEFGKSKVFNPFEDFRTYNGFGYILNNNITFFAGHMWTYGQKSSGYQYKTNHILRFNVFIGLDARKADQKIPPINMGY